MIVLAIDTCLGACQVAVFSLAAGADGVVLAQASEPMTRGHQERLAPMAREVMAAAGLAFSDLDRIGVTVGPGSFTGLRVGLAFAKGLGLALERPCVGVGTLEALARAAEAPGAVAAMIDAGRGRLFMQLFGAGEPVGAPESVEAGAALEGLAALVARLSGAGDTLTVVGPAAEAAQGLPGVRRIPLVAPPAAVVAAIAARAPLAPAAPLYLRAPDATPPRPERPRTERGRPRLRALRSGEAQALADIHAQAFAGSAGQAPWDAASLAALVAAPGTVALAAEIDGRMEAFILARLAADEAEILTLATRPERRRRGLAFALVEAVAARAAARGAGALILEVAEDAAAALALYAKAGFAPVGRRRGYYGRGEDARDAVIMRRALNR